MQEITVSAPQAGTSPQNRFCVLCGQPLVKGALFCGTCGEKAPKPQLVSQGTRTQNQYTYEDYTAQTAEEAKYFLEQTVVTQPLYYVMVHTPEGDWGRDLEGIFLSRLCAFQHDLSLRQCDAVTAPVPERTPDAQMAANKNTDNFTLSVTCGMCGHSWIDGVGYGTKTIVRCPECGAYNLADTGHIQVDRLQPKKRRKKRLQLFIILCGIYIAANLICLFLLSDELHNPDGTVMTLLGMFGNAVSIIGVVLLLVKRRLGIVVALAGSAIGIAFTILSGIFIIGVNPHFDTAGFIGFMLFSVLPGLMLSLQMRLSKHKSDELKP